jgi:hypothetical protein
MVRTESRKNMPVRLDPARRRAGIALLAGLLLAAPLAAQSGSRAPLPRIAVFAPAGHNEDAALSAALAAATQSIELSLVVLGRYDVQRLPPADPEQDLPRVRSYCEANRIDQAILGSGAERADGGFDLRLLVYDRQTDSLTLDQQGSSSGALDLFDATDALVASLLDALSGTHLAFGSLTVNTVPSGAMVLLNGHEAGTSPLSFRGLPVGTFEITARLEDKRNAKALVTLADGQKASVTLTLANSLGRLTVSMPDDAQVGVTNKDTGQEQTINGDGSLELPAGEYELAATSPGLSTIIKTINVTGNATASWQPWTSGYIDVQVSPDGAAIMVDGVSQGHTPLLVRVDPGKPHRVELRMEGYQSVSGTVSVPAGKKMLLSQELPLIPKPEPGEPAPDKPAASATAAAKSLRGYVIVGASPWGLVGANGVNLDVGAAFAAIGGYPPGSFGELELRYGQHIFDLSVAAGIAGNTGILTGDCSLTAGIVAGGSTGDAHFALGAKVGFDVDLRPFVFRVALPFWVELVNLNQGHPNSGLAYLGLDLSVGTGW